jgi:hypothetical protein
MFNKYKFYFIIHSALILMHINIHASQQETKKNAESFISLSRPALVLDRQLNQTIENQDQSTNGSAADQEVASILLHGQSKSDPGKAISLHSLTPERSISAQRQLIKSPSHFKFSLRPGSLPRSQSVHFDALKFVRDNRQIPPTIPTSSISPFNPKLRRNSQDGLGAASNKAHNHAQKNEVTDEIERNTRSISCSYVLVHASGTPETQQAIQQYFKILQKELNAGKQSDAKHFQEILTALSCSGKASYFQVTLRDNEGTNLLKLHNTDQNIQKKSFQRFYFKLRPTPQLTRHLDSGNQSSSSYKGDWHLLTHQLCDIPGIMHNIAEGQSKWQKMVNPTLKPILPSSVIAIINAYDIHQEDMQPIAEIMRDTAKLVAASEQGQKLVTCEIIIDSSDKTK